MLNIFEKPPDNWKIVKFGTVLLGGARSGIYKAKQFHGTGIKMINMGELFENPRLKSVPMERIQLTEKEANRFDIKVGDLIFARRSLVAEGAGKCSIVCEVLEPTTFESSIIRARPNPEIANSFYLYYLFNSPLGKYLIGTILRHVAVAGITGSDLIELMIPLPPISTQNGIAHILGSLDDKIELNRKINETLEAMARAIFRSWFVDFDPVRVKAESRQPIGMDAETAALFPSELEFVEGREMPRGWKVGRLDELMILQRGFDLPRTKIEEGPYPVVCASGVIGSHNKFIAKGPGVTTGRSGVIGKVFFIQENFWPHNTSLWVREYKISKPHHAFFTLQRLDLDIFNAGSAVATLNRNHIHNLPVLIPPEKLVDKFEAIVKPLFYSVHNSEQQSHTLAQLRDALLPKLMSGEINVSQINGIIQDTA